MQCVVLLLLSAESMINLAIYLVNNGWIPQTFPDNLEGFVSSTEVKGIHVITPAAHNNTCPRA